MRLRLRPGARLRAILGPDAAGVRQSLVALGLNSTSSLVAGAFLGSITGTFERYPGLLVLVPAAIGLRGNIFGTFGSRISTTIHSGTFRLSTRPDTVLGQNVLAASILTLAMSLLLAVTSKAIAVAFGVDHTIGIADLAIVSVLGVLLASVLVLFLTVGMAGGISAMAGILLEKRFGSFSAYPALLVLVPAQLSSAGALGGILSGRLSSKIHLGIVIPQPRPDHQARSDMLYAYVLALPVFAFNGIGAHFVGRALGHASPGMLRMVVAAMAGGLVAMLFVLALAYYGTILAVRGGVDPDTYGIPVVSSSVDFIGAFTLILAIVTLGIS